MGKRRGKKQKQLCYMCRKSATSREHVPPLCFFPEDDKFRKNLITVPSCDQHNSEKSGDDEYIFAIITVHKESNQIALHQFRMKILQALKRRSWLVNTFFKNLRPIIIGEYETGSFHVDKERLNNSINQISRGIYYHHFRKCIELPSTMISYSLFADRTSEAANETNEILNKWREYSTKEMNRRPKYGANPTVYYYQVIKDNDSDSVAIRHVFYEGVVIDVLFEG